MESQLDNVEVESSGSIGQYYNGKCHETNPNTTIGNNNIKKDWCSNIAKGGSSIPWITYSIKGKSMKLRGYSIRSGCCYFDCCCVDNEIIPECCCCALYSFFVAWFK
jgi:hypothetical protein